MVSQKVDLDEYDFIFISPKLLG